MPQNLINKFNKQAVTRPYESYATMQRAKALHALAYKKVPEA
jgi:hypothetical protein